MGAWGISPWGLSSWATSSPSAGISIANAFATSTHSVRVTLSAEPKHSNGLDDGDALNPQIWTIQRLDTGVFFTVLAVREHDPPFVYELRTLEPLGSHLVIHRVESTTLMTPSDVLISDPTSADFLGCVVTVDPVSQTAARNYSPNDLRNPSTPTGLDSLGGTLVITTFGDYELEEGATLLRKLVIRRLITKPGEFRHIPNYGVGLIIKEPVPAHDLPRLESEIERQLLREPDVEAVSAKVALATATGILTVQLRIKQRTTGQQVEIGLKVPSTGVLQL